MITDKMKNVKLRGTSKIVTVIIFINVIIIAVYLIPTGKIFSAYYVISSSPNDHDPYNGGRYGHTKRLLDSDSNMEEDDDIEEDSYSPAFPKNKRPAYLSHWSPALDSHSHFQPLSDSMGWVYSAFYLPPDGEEIDPMFREVKPLLRVFVIGRKGKTFSRVATFLYIFNENEEQIAVLKARRYTFKDGRSSGFTPYFYESSIPDDIGSKPHYVSLSFNKNSEKPTNRVTIEYPGHRERDFTVCFSPLHTNYNFTAQLVEAFEFNQLLGASHFFIYNFSTSPETDAILKSYESDGLVTIIRWPLPILDMWYYGQVLAINDCVYRNRGTSKYVVVVDTDELIVPNQHFNWSDLVDDVIKTPSMREDPGSDLSLMPDYDGYSSLTSPNSKFGVLSIRCGFYSDKRLSTEELTALKKYEFSLEQKQFLHRFPSTRILDLKRQDEPFPHGRRSKTIVRPECVEVSGIHKVPVLKSGCKTAYVSADAALLHHYREYYIAKINTLDLSTLKFKDEYLKRLEKSVKRFPGMFHFS